MADRQNSFQGTGQRTPSRQEKGSRRALKMSGQIQELYGAEGEEEAGHKAHLQGGKLQTVRIKIKYKRPGIHNGQEQQQNTREVNVMEEKKINPLELLQNAAAEITKASQSLGVFRGQLENERNSLVSDLGAYRQELYESKIYLEAKCRTLSEKIENTSEKGIKVDTEQLKRENEKLKDYVERLKEIG